MKASEFLKEKGAWIDAIELPLVKDDIRKELDKKFIDKKEIEDALNEVEKYQKSIMNYPKDKIEQKIGDELWMKDTINKVRKSLLGGEENDG